MFRVKHLTNIISVHLWHHLCVFVTIEKGLKFKLKVKISSFRVVVLLSFQPENNIKEAKMLFPMTWTLSQPRN